jgi:hypothetical protein
MTIKADVSGAGTGFYPPGFSVLMVESSRHTCNNFLLDLYFYTECGGDFLPETSVFNQITICSSSKYGTLQASILIMN